MDAKQIYKNPILETRFHNMKIIYDLLLCEKKLKTACTLICSLKMFKVISALGGGKNKTLEDPLCVGGRLKIIFIS